MQRHTMQHVRATLRVLSSLLSSIVGKELASESFVYILSLSFAFWHLLGSAVFNILHLVVMWCNLYQPLWLDFADLPHVLLGRIYQFKIDNLSTSRLH